MTEFRCEQFILGPIEKLPNADTLGITLVHGGYPCIVKLNEFEQGQMATYVPVDSLVPVAHPFFKFLDEGKGKEYSRIKSRRLRGTFSMGLIVAPVDGAMEGEDVTERLGIKKYERRGDREGTPHDKTHKERRSETAHYEKRVWILSVALSLLVGASLFPFGYLSFPLFLALAYAFVKRNRNLSKRPTIPIYDIEGIRRYSNILEEGEQVFISEKVHGSSSRYVHTGKRFHVSSRTLFRPKGVKLPQVNDYAPNSDIWWTIAERYGLEEKLAKHPGIVLFGEVYGAVQDLKYGVPASEGVRFAAFDAMHADTRTYMNVGEFLEFCREIDVPVVPTLFQGPWSNDLVSLAEGKSVLPKADHIREGFVVKPLIERKHPMLGRVILKMASESYLTRKEKE